MTMNIRRGLQEFDETRQLAVDAIRVHPARSLLAILGIVIGIVTVVLVASVLVNLRNQVALLFRELGTDNIFAFHLTGDPYSGPSEAEASRRPLDPRFARDIERLAPSVRDVGVQMIVPTVVNSQALVARAGGNESDTVLVEGVSANYFDVVGAEFSAGRPFTALEERAGARVAVIGSSLSRALFGGRAALERTLTLAGETYTVVGELAPRKGGFFGENRQDNIRRFRIPQCSGDSPMPIAPCSTSAPVPICAIRRAAKPRARCANCASSGPVTNRISRCQRRTPSSARSIRSVRRLVP
jgi:putative ABC transport system permease protein